MASKSKFIVPLVVAALLFTFFYWGKYFNEIAVPLEIGLLDPLEAEYAMVDLVLSGLLDGFVAFFFGFFILGLLGQYTSKIFFFFHKLFRRNKRLKVKYAILNTGYTVTAWLMLKRAFLFYAIAISLSLTTIQAAGFVGLFPQVPVDSSGIPHYIFIFELTYTTLVFFFSLLLTFILPPVWYFDDLNVMYFKIEEGVKFLNPIGRSVLPSLAGFGGPTIVISYLVFLFNRIGTTVPILLLLDPLITLYIPILFLVGFETISFLGKRNLERWLLKQGIEEHDKLDYVLSSNEKIEKEEGETLQEAPNPKDHGKNNDVSGTKTPTG